MTRTALRPKVTVIHWKPAECEDQVARLQQAGYDTVLIRPEPGNRAAFWNSPCDIFIIDLNRLPSNGGAIGSMLRSTKRTRHIPIVFADGVPEKVEKIRAALPDVFFSSWKEILPVLKKALTWKPDAHAKAPGGVMAVYSGTLVAKKLGIKPGSTVTVIGAPDEYPECLDIPDDVEVYRRTGTASDRVLFFVDRLTNLEGRFRAAESCVAPGGGLWLIWPKASSGRQTDVNANIVREYALEEGWVDYKVCSVDKIWSGLLFSKKK